MRLDQYLKEAGYYPSRQKAQAAIQAGHVSLDGTVVKKASTPYEGARITCQQGPSYVSRSALKLKGALDAWGLSLKGLSGLDVGASTGGFTEVALEYGAIKMVAVDVGTDQLAPRLKGDDRVISMEKTHILKLTHLDPVDFIVIDVSFISSLKVLAHLKTITSFKWILVLFKPQFEAGEKLKSPVVKSPKLYQKIQTSYERQVVALGYTIHHRYTPIKGKEGNQEIMYHLEP